MTDFEQVYRDYFRDVYRYVRRLTGGDEHLAEDVTSEAFFRALRAIDTFRGDCDIRVWLCRIARNCCYSRLKRGQRSVPLEDAGEEIPAPETTPEEAVLRGDDARRAREALHAIPEPYREVFMWRTFGEMSFRQIGELFSRSENWACVTYHRARRMIRREMEVRGDEK